MDICFVKEFLEHQSHLVEVCVISVYYIDVL